MNWLRRLYLLVRIELLVNQKKWLLKAGIFALLFWLFGDLGSGLPAFQIALFIGGLSFTAQSMGALNQPHEAQQYLLLPASAAEKVFAKWLVTSLIYTAFVSLIYILFIGLTKWLPWIHQDHYMPPWNISFLLAMARYFVFHAVVLCAAVYFRKHVVLKIVLITGLAFLIFGHWMTSMLWDDPRQISNTAHLLSFLAQDIRFIFWYLLAPICWVASYMRFKNLQV